MIDFTDFDVSRPPNRWLRCGCGEKYKVRESE
jgi:hypothetical protein